jgi:hypothetical protein
MNGQLKSYNFTGGMKYTSLFSVVLRYQRNLYLLRKKNYRYVEYPGA